MDQINFVPKTDPDLNHSIKHYDQFITEQIMSSTEFTHKDQLLRLKEKHLSMVMTFNDYLTQRSNLTGESPCFQSKLSAEEFKRQFGQYISLEELK